MQQTLAVKGKRIESIDILRGIVMVIMALDHVRDYFHITANSDDPLNLATTSPALFFTRWVTHFCAPAFVFLSGTSIYLQSLRKTKAELSGFLIKRGLWLIFVEVAIISLAWTFNPLYEILALQVIWAIGISMFILGLIIRLPYKVILILGLIIVFGHNLLDIPESAPGFTPGFWWDLLHHGQFVRYNYAPGHDIIIAYPFLPWTGLMMLGYCGGVFFTS
ncbi:MAG: heparan-alpha-glucosaminide N-acetyltransferase domain-containing protein, partial [Ferruginibacter sp.]